jgi:hypothetical protein
MCRTILTHFLDPPPYRVTNIYQFLKRLEEIIMILNKVWWLMGSEIICCCYINYTEYMASDERLIICDDSERIRQRRAVTYFKLPFRIHINRGQSWKTLGQLAPLSNFDSHSRDKAVDIATGYGLDDREFGVRVPVGSRIFNSPYRPDRLWGPPNLLYNGYRGLFPRGWSVRSMNLNTPLKLVPRSRKCVYINPHPRTPSWSNA